ncbi:MAG: hypothetical protein A2V74_04470 [Acidobacteria bacterium RBG_16_70_10]|nr:MAG: hypothetical protein A2V74_04470 [Acidobacteria bacterium RBG_16_70_10]
MSERSTAVTAALVLALGALACSGPESRIVDQYFTALRANDTNTLSSFAMVALDKKVDDWKVVSIGAETSEPAPLPELVKKQKDLEAELAENQRDARAWANDLSIYPRLEQARELEKKNAKIPASLTTIHEKWTAFNDKDRQLKRALADAKAAVERERRNAQLSVGQRDDLDTLTGKTVSKQVELNLTIAGQSQPYVMTLRKYELDGGGGPRMIARWVVESLEPKG